MTNALGPHDILDGRIEVVRVRYGREPDADAGKLGQALEPCYKSERGRAEQ